MEETHMGGGWWFKLLRADQINQTSGGITAFIIHASLTTRPILMRLLSAELG
jgi:hypothetical protein